MAGKQPPPVFQRAPIIRRIEMDGDYQGAWVDMILNPPSSALDVIAAEMHRSRQATPADPYLPGPELRQAVARLIKDWNWADDEGTVLPSTAEGLALVDWESIWALIGAWGQARALPKPTPSASATMPAA